MLSKKELGLLVKQARAIKGKATNQKYTQTMLAEDLGISQGYIGDIESGRTYPKYSTLAQIAEICNLSLSYFDKFPSDGLTFADGLIIKNEFNEGNTNTISEEESVGAQLPCPEIEAQPNLTLIEPKRQEPMRVKDFLDLLANYVDVKIFDTELNEKPLFVGKALNCPYWIAKQQVLVHGDKDGWFVDKKKHLNIYCKFGD